MSVKRRVDALFRSLRERENGPSGDEVCHALKVFDECGSLEAGDVHPGAARFVQRLSEAVALAESLIPLEPPTGPRVTRN